MRIQIDHVHKFHGELRKKTCIFAAKLHAMRCVRCLSASFTYYTSRTKTLRAALLLYMVCSLVNLHITDCVQPLATCKLTSLQAYHTY